MGTQYLMDSNAVIDYLMGKMPVSGMEFMNEVINNVPNVSVITKIEVLGYNSSPATNKLLSNFFEDAVVFGLSKEVVAATIELRKEHKIKLPDALIAATAKVNKLEIITRNISDFKNISGLKIVDAHQK